METDKNGKKVETKEKVVQTVHFMVSVDDLVSS